MAVRCSDGDCMFKCDETCHKDKIIIDDNNRRISKQMESMQDKQCVQGVCQFCGMDGYYDEIDKNNRDELRDGWLILSDITAQLGGIYGEWCSRECFWNDLLRQSKLEKVKESD